MVAMILEVLAVMAVMGEQFLMPVFLQSSKRRSPEILLAMEVLERVHLRVIFCFLEGPGVMGEMEAGFTALGIWKFMDQIFQITAAALVVLGVEAGGIAAMA
jgi:hypothetical protein